MGKRKYQHKDKTFTFPAISGILVDKESSSLVDFEALDSYLGDTVIPKIKDVLTNKGYTVTSKFKLVPKSTVIDPLKSDEFFIQVNAKYIGKRRAKRNVSRI